MQCCKFDVLWPVGSVTFILTAAGLDVNICGKRIFQIFYA